MARIIEGTYLRTTIGVLHPNPPNPTHSRPTRHPAAPPPRSAAHPPTRTAATPQGDEDWHTFVLRAWADGDAAMMAIALEEPGAKRDATFSTCGGWGVIASGKVYFDGCTQAGWSGMLRARAHSD